MVSLRPERENVREDLGAHLLAVVVVHPQVQRNAVHVLVALLTQGRRHVLGLPFLNRFFLDPTTNGGMQIESSVGMYMYTTHTRFCTLGANLYAFLHQSSGGSLLRVRCWLGNYW